MESSELLIKKSRGVITYISFDKLVFSNLVGLRLLVVPSPAEPAQPAEEEALHVVSVVTAVSLLSSALVMFSLASFLLSPSRELSVIKTLTIGIHFSFAATGLRLSSFRHFADHGVA